MNLDAPALLAFLAIAETGSTHAAARSLGLSQASVSRRMSRLEATLGVPLFMRGGHQLKLSAAGAQLLPEAKAHVSGLMHALTEIRTTGGGTKTTITIGCLATLSLHVMPKVLADFVAVEPEIRVRLLDLPPAEIEQSVRSGSADFALTMLGVGAENMTHEVLAQQPLALFAPPRHALARRASVRWSDLEGLPLIGIGPHSANQRLLDSAQNSIAVNLESRHQVQRITTAIELVVAGIGFAVLPVSPEMTRRTKIAIVPITHPVIYRKIGILRRSGVPLSPPAARLRRLIAAHLRKDDAASGRAAEKPFPSPALML